MKIIADTNVILRALVADDPIQARAAVDCLASADVVAVPLQTFCELAWVLLRSYQTSRADVMSAIERLMETRNVTTDAPAVEAGLAILKAGGDFADGVIAHQGRWLGGETFVSFDKQAVKFVSAGGAKAILLA